MNINWSKIIDSNLVCSKVTESLSTKNLPGHFEPTKVDYLLKQRLHALYAEAVSRGSKIKIVDLIKGICTTPNFYQSVITNKERLKWIFSMDDDLYVFQRMMKERAMDKAFQIINQDFSDENGKIDIQVLKEQVKVIEIVLAS